jgi:hypothetical protein
VGTGQVPGRDKTVRYLEHRLVTAGQEGTATGGDHRRQP